MKRGISLILIILSVFLFPLLPCSVAEGKEAPTLTLFLIGGQSNAEGVTSANISVDIQRSYSIACDPGSVYSSYMPLVAGRGKNIAGVNFSRVGSSSTADYFVPVALDSDTAIAGNNLDYPLESLTSTGQGKTGMDSGLAYEWNRLTKEKLGNEHKVWVANAAVNGSSILEWLPGKGDYNSATAFFDDVIKTYNAEIASGNFSRGNIIMFWLQGEKDKDMPAKDYEGNFKKVIAAFSDRYGLDEFGIVAVRSASGHYTSRDDVKLTGPRIAQYVMATEEAYGNLFLVSNVNEKWTDSDGVKEYFSDSYPSGYLTYPTQVSGQISIPKDIEAVHYDIHFSQIAHNENGITAARGMFEILYGSNRLNNILWMDEDYEEIEEVSLQEGESRILIPVPEPCYGGHDINVSVASGKNKISYDRETGILKGLKEGTAIISARGQGGIRKRIKVSVEEKTNFSDKVGSNYTGLYKYDGVWKYLKNAYVDYGYHGLVKNSKGYWYVRNGVVDFSYTGIVPSGKSDGNYYFVRRGKWDNSFTGLAKSVVNGEYYFARNGKLDRSFTGIAKSITDSKYYFVRAGRLNRDFTGLAKSVVNGQYYFVRSGVLDWDFTGLAKSVTNGQYYFARNGKLDWNFTGLAKSVTNGQYYFARKGRLDWSFTGVAKSVTDNNYYFVREGSFDRSYTGLAISVVNDKYYYVRNGKLDWNFTGIAQRMDNGETYYVKDGKVAETYSGSVMLNGQKWIVNGGKAHIDLGKSKEEPKQG